MVAPCADSDAEGLWALFSQREFRRYAMMDEAEFETPETVKLWLRASGPDAFRITGTIAGKVVGFAGLFPLQGRQNHVGWITLGVHEGFRGRGIGTSLLRLIHATAQRRAGLRRLQLHSLVDNAAALALYQGLGFRIEGRHAGLVQSSDGDLDVFTLAKPVRSAEP